MSSVACEFETDTCGYIQDEGDWTVQSKMLSIFAFSVQWSVYIELTFIRTNELFIEDINNWIEVKLQIAFKNDDFYKYEMLL